MKVGHALLPSVHRARPVPRFAAAILTLSIPCYAAYTVLAPMAYPYAADFAINYSAATVLRTGASSIYERVALRDVHDQRIGYPAALLPLYTNTGLYNTYINPPTTALLHVPFSLLPFPVARMLFLILSNAMYLGAIFLLLRLLNVPLPTAEGIMALACALTFFPIAVSYSLGQVDSAIILAFALALFAAMRRRDAYAGALIVAAASIKVSPALALAFFVAQRRLSALKGALIAAVAIGLCTTALAGPATVHKFVADILPCVSRGSALFENQSLLAAIYRFVLPASVVKAEIGSLNPIAEYPGARLLWVCLSLLLVAITFVLVRRAKVERPELMAIALGAFILIGVLTGSIAWDHYAVWVLIPVIGLVIDWFRTQWLPPGAFWSVFVLGMGAVNFPTLLELVLYDILGPGVTSLGTYGMLILLVLLWIRLRRADVGKCS